MKAMAWAILCKSGEVHAGDENCCLFLDRGQALDYMKGEDPFDYGCQPDDDGCGPHRIVGLYRRAS